MSLLLGSPLHDTKERFEKKQLSATFDTLYNKYSSSIQFIKVFIEIPQESLKAVEVFWLDKEIYLLNLPLCIQILWI